ncbi:MAG: hypothetical protein N4A33_04740 [Bacteriovoracaceae bacterium]|jgi:hypothetical protein|nr:hypothetical protein [Bacteriovoracaceae bacterium]
MKLLIAIMLIISSINAKETCQHATVGNEDTVNFASSAMKITENLNLDPAPNNLSKNLIMKMCMKLALSIGSKDTVEVTRQQVLEILGKDTNSSEPTVDSYEVVNFFNTHLDKIVCTDTKHNPIRSKVSYFKYNIQIGNYAFVEKYLYKTGCTDDASKKLDLNAYDMIDEKKETIVDYLDLIIEDENNHVQYDIKRLKEIRSGLVHCGAKKAEEL